MSTLRENENATGSRSAEPQTFVETALKLGGKSEEEARKTGTLDRADDRSRRCSPRSTRRRSSPVHRAVWDDEFPLDLFRRRRVERPARAASGRWSESLEVVRRHRAAGTLLDEQRQGLRRGRSRDLAEAGYWGLLVDPRIRRPGRAVRGVRHVPDADGDDRCRPSPGWPRSTAASARSIRCGPSAAPSRSAATCRGWPAANGSRLRPDRARRRLRPDRAADARPCSTATTTSSTARSCSSPTPSPAGRSAWSA